MSQYQYCARVDRTRHANLLLQVHVRKVKLLKQPKFDLGNLLSLHGESTSDDSGQKVQNTDFKEPAPLESV